MSKESWEDAAKSALLTASNSFKDLRVAEVTKLDVALDETGKIARFRAKLDGSFKVQRSGYSWAPPVGTTTGVLACL